MSGRKRDGIGSEINKISQERVKCIHCNYESSAQAYRMKKHFDEKHTYITIKTSRQCKTLQSTNMDKFVVRTTPDMTKSFDMAVGKLFLAANTNFAVMENSHFTQLIEKVHPGYKPPTRKRLCYDYSLVLF